MKNNGFTLIEVLIVLVIVVLIAFFGIGFYMNYNKNVEINSLAETIVSDLKQAQSRSMTGEGGFKWGIHFVNNTNDYYEIFSTPTDYNDVLKTVISRNPLFSGVSFSSPILNATTDIVFNKISGGTTASSLSLISGNFTKTINVSSVGVVSIQ